MLINCRLKDPDFGLKQILDVISMVNNQEAKIKQVSTGLYTPGHWSLHYQIANLKAEYPMFNTDPWLVSYGVCDSIDQWLAHSAVQRHVIDTPTPYCASFVQLLKSRMHPIGGWRWHKWGPYIGLQEPTCEYLFDEPLINEVWTYHIYELLEEGIAYAN